MAELAFFTEPVATTLADIAALTGAHLVDPSRGAVRVTGVAPLDQAGPADLTFFENRKYASQLPHTHAAACFVAENFEGQVPSRVAVLRTKQPYAAFVAVLRRFYPEALAPGSMFGTQGIAATASVHPTARLEDNVTIDPGAMVGPYAEIGSGTVIGPGVAIGPHVRIGRDCRIGAGTTVAHSLIGNDVLIHPGCRIGQDGFGFVPGPNGHAKVPQVGRVIIQNAVEIGAGTTVDRGAIKDTMIGEGTKIDNLVQIGHNVSIGRHCIIVSHSGLAGSCTLEDGVMLGARSGVGNHVTVGAGAQIAALGVVAGDVPPGERWGGFPARPMKLWLRELRALSRLSRDSAAKESSIDNREGR
jgi:UDP-3-O-[3-hydroxymyristoyl] glucosamine N-acyltransferase